MSPAPAGRSSSTAERTRPGADSGLSPGVEQPRDLGPVDDVPPGLEVCGTLVLILEVIGVLPHVDAEQRLVALHVRRVLIRRRVRGQAGAVPDEPRPAAAEALHTAVRDRRLQLRE